MHTVAKPVRSNKKKWAEKWTVDEATRKLALRIARIKKVQPSYTPRPGVEKIREIERWKTTGVQISPGALPGHAEVVDLIH
jgi:hypothetical protein